MIALLLLAFQVALAAPKEGRIAFRGPILTNPASLIKFEDYPPGAIERREQGRTRIALSVDPLGKVVSCIVTQSSGSRILDDTGCRLLSKRARFRPATIEGKAVSGVFMTYTTFVVAEPGAGVPDLPPSFDFAIGVSKLPPGASSLAVTIDRVIAADGTAGACQVARSSGVATYDALACRNAGAPPIKGIVDDAGAPAQGVVTGTSLFVAAPMTTRPR